MIRPALLFIAWIFFSTTARAEVPRLLNYQGNLQTSTDSLVTGAVRIVFSIYNVETSGEALWSETHLIQATSGRFHTLLGSITPLPEDLFSSNNLYLALQIDNDPELTPRQRIVSTAYAFRADRADRANRADQADRANQADRADDVPEKNISPKSLALSGGKAVLDSTGNLVVNRLSADSLTIGGTGVINRLGNWTGPAIPFQLPGLVLDTIIVKNVQDTLDIPADPRWTAISQFRFISVKLDRSGYIELTFNGSVDVLGSIQTRLVVERRENGIRVERLENISNVSGITTDGSQSFRSAPVSNSAALALAEGQYLVSVEARVNGALAKLYTGILLVKISSRHP